MPKLICNNSPLLLANYLNHLPNAIDRLRYSLTLIFPQPKLAHLKTFHLILIFNFSAILIVLHCDKSIRIEFIYLVYLF